MTAVKSTALMTDYLFNVLKDCSEFYPNKVRNVTQQIHECYSKTLNTTRTFFFLFLEETTGTHKLVKSLHPQGRFRMTDSQESLSVSSGPAAHSMDFSDFLRGKWMQSCRHLTEQHSSKLISSRRKEKKINMRNEAVFTCHT